MSKDMHGKVKISSSIVRGLYDYHKRKDLFNYLRNKNFQICCLQDTHFMESLEPYIGSEWGGNVIYNFYTSNSRGGGVFFSATVLSIKYLEHKLMVQEIT